MKMPSKKPHSRALNMYPVRKAEPEVHTLFAMCRDANISMRKLCIEAGVHQSIPGRWRRGETGATNRIMGKLLTKLKEIDPDAVKRHLTQ